MCCPTMDGGQHQRLGERKLVFYFLSFNTVVSNAGFADPGVVLDLPNAPTV